LKSCYICVTAFFLPMSNEFLFRLLISVVALILTDTLLYFGLRRLLVKQGRKSPGSKRFKWTYLSITLIFALYAVVHYLYLKYFGYGPDAYRQSFFITGVFLLLYLPKIVMLCFILVGRALLFIFQLISYLIYRRGHYDFVRRTRKFKVLSWVGFVMGILMFGCVLYGMLYTRTDYRVKNVSLSYRNLPPSFNGVRVLVIADVHLGSFFNTRELFPAFQKMNELNPDMIIFAGDMINVSAEETQPYINFFAEMKPPLGKYSVLGNHDQDDYMKFTKSPDREITETQLMLAQQAMGFSLLRNEHLFIRKGNDSIAMIGVDSWGHPPFHAYGDLKKAMNGVPSQGFKILLSHIPNHWAEEVKGKTNIDLTIAGHTHAAQIGIDEPWLQWSPIVYKYPLYMGLYQWGNQYLYVNTGLGYIGFPGRIGIAPEITMITLNRK